ncbi:hypothetical protein Nepgr_028796 [Nepenthes gracilis]|uniref:Transmembrane protein n=1 Tax=Nepenthes gracilis TaxID=150966 RepID=A0AAD3Y2Q7_NEPGR|nr:hypothetical protein Nepgr_028796 [Nepenthes gracilis]
MEETSWEERLHALTHILTTPTTTPSLHSQLFISTRLPIHLNWDYPPLLLRSKPPNSTFPSPYLRWGFSLFLKRVSRFGIPLTSWRSKCPYHQPPPLILAEGVEEARWGSEEMRRYARKRLLRRRLGCDVNPVIPVLVPNLLLFSVLLWNPFPGSSA